MSSACRVSVIMPFLDTPVEFFDEAVASVMAQTVGAWELLLVDDGSTVPEVIEAARRHVARDPDRIRCLQHPGGGNRGIGASRRLALLESRGEIVAMLDSDDVWPPTTLAEQLSAFDLHPHAGACYGNTLYWSSWAGDDRVQEDYQPDLGVRTGRVHEGVRLLELLVRQRAAVPCPCSIAFRRPLLVDCDAFEAAARGMYEDQILYAKALLRTSVFVSDRCWGRYRLHSGSLCHAAEQRGEVTDLHARYLEWLDGYVREQGVDDPALSTAIRRRSWQFRRPRWVPASQQRRVLRFKKWIVRAADAVSRG